MDNSLIISSPDLSDEGTIIEPISSINNNVKKIEHLYEQFKKSAEICKNNIHIDVYDKNSEILTDMNRKIIRTINKNISEYIDSDDNATINEIIEFYKQDIKIVTNIFIEKLQKIIPAEYVITVST